MKRDDPKKSETLEVRVPWRLKQDFMARARREGRSASEVVRELMESYVRRPAQRTTTQTLETAMTTIRNHPRRAGFAAILGAAGISAVLAGAIPAAAGPDLRAQFERLDANSDGVVTQEEMAPGAGVQEFRLERRTSTGDGEVVLQAPDGPGGAVELPRGPDGAPAPGTETVGPILLPATGPDGEQRVMMMQTTRRFSADDGEQQLEMTTPAPLNDEFQAGDTNGDGAMSFEEFEARYAAVRTASFDALDADSDGVISAAEIDGNPLDAPDSDMAATALRSADSDGDGQVTRAEYEAAV